jgi:hypothetical protein
MGRLRLGKGAVKSKRILVVVLAALGASLPLSAEAAAELPTISLSVPMSVRKDEPFHVAISGEVWNVADLFLGLAGNGCGMEESQPPWVPLAVGEHSPGPHPYSVEGDFVMRVVPFHGSATCTLVATVLEIFGGVEEGATEATARQSITVMPSAYEEAEAAKQREEQARQAKEAEEAAAWEAAAKAAGCPEEEWVLDNRKKCERIIAEEQRETRENEERVQELARNLAAPIRKLGAWTVAIRGHSRRRPGRTELWVATAPWGMHVTVKLRRHGHLVRRFSEWPGRAPALIIPWSCSSPGGVYHYTVTAHSGVGGTLTRHGRFKPVSVALCHKWKHAEAEARRRREEAALRRYKREQQEAAEEVQRYRTNCEKLGGKPVILEVQHERRWYCKAPNGGALPVPH